MYFRRRSTRSSVLTISFYPTAAISQGTGSLQERMRNAECPADGRLRDRLREGCGPAVFDGSVVVQVGRQEIGNRSVHQPVAAARGLVSIHEVIGVGE